MKITALATCLAACLALALAGLPGSRAAAASLTFSVPLVAHASDLAAPTLSGTLSYDIDGQNDSGTFTLGDYTNTFAGSALTLQLDTGLGVEFLGDATDGSELFFNILLATAGTSTASGVTDSVYLSAPGLNEAYDSYTGSIVTPSDSTLPGGTTTAGVSPVPLPPAAGLFGGALLLLAGGGATRHLRRVAAAGRGRGAAA